jgi:hypothetical protein
MYFNYSSAQRPKVNPFYLFLAEDNCIESGQDVRGIIVKKNLGHIISKCITGKDVMSCQHQDEKTGKEIEKESFKVRKVQDGVYFASSPHTLYRLSFKEQKFSYHRTAYKGSDHKLVTEICTGTIF